TGTGSGGGTATDPCPEVGATHLLISEIASHGPPGAGGGSVGGNYEFIEIWNPTGAQVDLSKYYLSDNSVYYRIARGDAWTPTTSMAGTDFLVKFPAGATIDANGYVVIQAGPDFESAWSSCPDYALGTDTAPTCNSTTVPLMEAPTNGDRGSEAGSMLSNTREMVVLFCWDGVSTIVKDVDYVPWGDTDDQPMRINKTNEPGYQPDTAVSSQDEAPYYHTTGSGGGFGASLGRCDGTEDGETTTNGNGPAGHDETSESFSQTIEIQGSGTPGAVNSCN
ncbi:MAG: lamin tail domain-containing protein, partial [Deltaproteobacteria bacterium]|nr:lamin tail domain-containing protein [Deltaproteobacteria bacterium]MBW2534235.1 lamin tail domain-containing protein [Deltaproteobacteria bacterium]